MKTLSELPAGTFAIVHSILGGRKFGLRATALGFSPGSKVSVVQNFGHGPMIVIVHGSNIALGRGEASQIQVKPE